VFGMYVNYRYDERKEPSDEKVMTIKEAYFENLK